MSLLREYNQRLSERKGWEAAHPDLAKAWTEALMEDALRHASAVETQARLAVESALPPRMAIAGVPDLAIQHSRAPEDTEATRAARQFLQGTQTFLVLCGERGLGKTTAAAVVVREYLRRDALTSRPTSADPPAPALFERATSFARMSAYDAEDRRYFESLCRARLLVLDDVGTETLAGVATALLDELVDTRYGHRRRMVITSNLSPAAIRARYGERIADRLRESGLVVALAGASMRGKGAK